MALLFVGVVFAAVWCALPASRPRPGPVAISSRPSAGVPAAALGCSLGAAVGLSWWWGGWRPMVLALLAVAVAVAAGVSRLLLRRRRSTRAAARAESAVAACEALASELSAGQPPLLALRRAVDAWPELTPVAAAGELSADVPDALRDLAALPGAGQLRVVAAAWQVAHQTGGGLAEALNRCTVMLREDRATTRLVAAELAAARSTAVMLAVLPALVLLLGVGLGGDPIGFLAGTPAGLACLAAGLLLSYTGLAWINRIADGVMGR